MKLEAKTKQNKSENGDKYLKLACKPISFGKNHSCLAFSGVILRIGNKFTFICMRL